MKRDNMLRELLTAQPTASNCEYCRQQLQQFVNAEVRGLDVEKRYPSIGLHLSLCSTCMTQYLVMSEFAYE